VKWTLYGGKMVGKSSYQIVRIPGYQGIEPGDVVFIPDQTHHFIVTDIDYGTNTLWSVDGNTYGQKIRALKKKIWYTGAEASTKTPWGYYRILT
jgi:hypothetical protein